jgi:hypothetical protein
MARSVLAVFLGLVLAVVTIVVLESVGHAVYPPPLGLDLSDPASLRAHVANMPTGAFLLLLLGWFLGAFAGSWLAARLARRAPTPHALVVGGVLVAATVANVSMIPHPAWVVVLGLLGLLPSAYAGAWLAGRGKGWGRPGVIGAGSP